MRHYEIICHGQTISLSATQMLPQLNGQVYFYDFIDGDERIVHVVPDSAFILDITKEAKLDDLTKELLDSIMEYYNEADHRVFNDLPIFDKEEVRKEAVKISKLCEKIQEIKERIKI